MSGQWYYKMFGQEFGPITFGELKSLAEFGTISNDDEVRQENSQKWQLAVSVSELNLAATAGAERSTSSVETEAIVISGPHCADDWYCKLYGQELGPLSFEELVECSENGQFSAEDEVKLGVAGEWRRLGAIGQLVAVSPHQELQSQTSKSAGSVRAAVPMLPSQSRSATGAPTVAASSGDDSVELALNKANATQSAAEQASRQVMAWACSANFDQKWWACIGGVEYGPVDFSQILGWATDGRMHSTDLIRNGLHGQYVASVNVPGLFHAASLMKQAAEACDLAKSRTAGTHAEAKISPPPVSPQAAALVEPARPAVAIRSADPTTISIAATKVPTAVVASNQRVQSASDRLSSAEPRIVKPVSNPVNPTTEWLPARPNGESMPVPLVVASSGGTSARMPDSSASRPTAVPSGRSAPRRRWSSPSSSSLMIERLKGPGVIAVAAIVVPLVLFAGWKSMHAGPPGRSPLGKVSGKVTCKGEMIQEAMIVFHNPSGRSATGQIVGGYIKNVTTYDTVDDGAPLGTLTVTIHPTRGRKPSKPPKPGESPQPPARPAFSDRYGDPMTSGLKAEIRPGSNQASFDLTD